MPPQLRTPRPRPLALESPLLRAAGFRHGFSTRPLDFRPGGSELSTHEESLALLLRMRRDHLYRVAQVHGSRAIVASGDPAEVAKEQADALVAGPGDVAVMVRVADCVPILLADTRTGAVAAAHAGWRGLALGVIAKTFEQGATLGAHFDLAAIGPCIGVCCYEVDEDVAEKVAASSSADVIRRESTAGKPHVDLRRAARVQLAALGLQNTHIDDVPGCTRCDAELFFSHRRDGEACGRQVGVIAAMLR